MGVRARVRVRSQGRADLTVLIRKSIEFMLDGFHLSSDWHVPG